MFIHCITLALELENIFLKQNSNMTIGFTLFPKTRHKNVKCINLVKGILKHCGLIFHYFKR